jgi:hypothetical protein
MDKMPGSPLDAVRVVAVLDRGVFVSLYRGGLTELTTVQCITASPSATSTDKVTVEMGPGIKLDKMPDGWSIKQLSRQQTDLSREFLAKRGWNLELLFPR